MNTSIEDRKRRARLYLLASFVFLIVIWIFKFSHPQFSIIPSSPFAKAPTITTLPPEKPGPKEKWHDAPSSVSTLSQSGGRLISPEDSKIVLGEKAAVIIQPNFRQNVIPLILHFAVILGPSWPVFIYTTAEEASAFTSSASLKRYLETQIQIRILPQTVLLNSAESLTAFLTNSWIWESLEPAEHVLMFDSESMLCGNAARSVEDYFEYAFIGAPIREGLGKGFNGGLSLRRRSSMLRVLDAWDWEQTKKPGDKFEDQWFYNRLKDLQREDDSAGIASNDPKFISIPTVEVARTFSVETVDYPHPLGVHQVHRFQKASLSKLNEWCPEYKLCSADINFKPRPPAAVVPKPDVGAGAPGAATVGGKAGQQGSGNGNAAAAKPAVKGG